MRNKFKLHGGLVNYNAAAYWKKIHICLQLIHYGNFKFGICAAVIMGPRYGTVCYACHGHDISLSVSAFLAEVNARSVTVSHWQLLSYIHPAFAVCGECFCDFWTRKRVPKRYRCSCCCCASSWGCYQIFNVLRLCRFSIDRYETFHTYQWQHSTSSYRGGFLT